MAKHAPVICTSLVYHRKYNTYLVLLIPGTSLWASTTTTTAVLVYNNGIYMTLCTEHFTCSIFGTTTTAAVTTAVVVVVVAVVVILTHR